MTSDMPSRTTMRKVGELCLASAEVLLASGAETHRVEDTCTRIGNALNMEVNSFVTPTGIIISVGGEISITRLVRIKSRTLDMNKVILANNLSHSLTNGDISLTAALHKIHALAKAPKLYNGLQIYIGQALSCAGFALILDGTIYDTLPAFLIGLIARYVDVAYAGLPPFLAVFVNAFFVSLTACLGHYFFPDLHQEITIISGLVPLLPGYTMASALADLMAGELLAGIARLTDSGLVAAALAGGAACGMSIGQLL